MADIDKLKAYTTSAVVLARPTPEAGQWLAVEQAAAPVMDQRDRVGRHAANTLFGSSTGSPYPERYARSDRLLTDEQLWLVYQRTPDVRAAVDAIVRRVATWDWLVEPSVPPSDDAWEQAHAEAQAASTFLQAPNTDGETWQELWTKVCTDLLVFDAGVIENVYGGDVTTDGVQPGDDLEELVALRGSTVYPVVDGHGHVLGYRQNATGLTGQWLVYDQDSETTTPTFGTDQIVYMRLFPNTASPLGQPLVETLVNEIITMLRASEHSMLAFDADEIPPGILVLTGIAGKAAQAAKADLQALRGKDHKVRVITNPDPKATGAHWVELRHTAKDVDFVNVVAQVRRTIWRVFGVMPVEMGASEDIPRAVGQVQLDVSTSHLIGPILELVEAKINARILPLVVDDPTATQRIRFRFDRESKLSPSEQRDMADTLVALVREGVLTRNEARAIRGDQPVVGGDVVTLTTGQGVFPLTSVVGMTADGEPLPPGDLDDDSPDDDPDGGPGGSTPDGPPPPGDVAPPGTASTPGDALDVRSPACRLADESEGDCIARKVPEVLAENPGMERDQAVAVAASLCSTACADRSTDGINMTPPQSVRTELERGLAWHEEGHSGDGLRPATVAWARRLARGEDITPDKARKMRAWLARHEVDKQGQGFNPGEDGYPSPGRVAWALWGGDPAVPWSNKLVGQLDAADGSRLRSITDPDLPSAWQSTGPFRGRRVLDLVALHDVVADYSRAVSPLYEKAQAEATAMVRAAYRPGTLSQEEADALVQRINRTIDRLEREWAMATDSLYQRAARLGVDRARDWSGLPVGQDYRERAMAWLRDSGGMLADLRARVQVTINALVAQRARGAKADPRLGATVGADVAADAMFGAYAAEQHRIANWSGRLVEVANATLAAGVLEASTSVVDGAPRPTEWWVEWVHVGDRAMCATCTVEGQQGFRPLSQLPTVPGGDTECRARCRCVLVLWTRDEVERGSAQRLGPQG
jgi:hypothetical protein